MASPNIYTGGLGGSAGSLIATGSPLYASGRAWYVHHTGTDAASPQGRERNRPLATIGQALSNASNNDIIVCLEGHDELITAITTISKTGLSIVGEGTGANRPSFTRDVNDEMFDITGAGIRLDNLRFPASSTASALAKVRIATAGCIVSNCYFEAAETDDGPQLEFVTGAGQCRVRATTFLSTATSAADRPGHAIAVTNAMSDLWVGGEAQEDAVVIDGGASGWAQPFAWNIAGAVTRLNVINVDLLNDSDIQIVTGTLGFIITRNESGSARIEWAA